MKNLCGVHDANGVLARDLLVQLGPTLRVAIGFDESYDPRNPSRLADLPAEGALAGVDLTLGDHKILLGRDFLRNFTMIYDGPSGAVDLVDPLQPVPVVVEDE